MVLADTSAWVEYDRAAGSAVDLRLTELIGAEADLAVTEPVIMEVAAGARDDRREQDLRRLLGRFELLALDAGVDFEGATQVYRTCRRAGITPRGLLDCMIATVAMRSDAAVLAHDGDFSAMASVLDLRLDAATPGGSASDG